MKSLIKISALVLFLTSIFAFAPEQSETYSLTVKVKDLRNSKGEVLFSIYNKDKTIPDEDLDMYHLQKKGTIKNGESTVTFYNLPKGTYAVNIVHDEDKDGEIDKGWFLPIEGVGFSNFKSINLANRPNFKKASFVLDTHTTKEIKIIYM